MTELVRRLPLRRWRGPAIAVGLVAAAFGLRVALGTMTEPRPLLILFMLPILLSAVLGGVRSGLLATALACLAVVLRPIPADFLFSGRLADWVQWILLWATGIGVSVVAHALQRVREAEQRAYLERARFEALAEHGTDLIGIFDAELRALYLNAAGRRMIGLESGPRADQPPRLRDAVAPGDRNLIDHELLPRLAGADRAELEIRLGSGDASDLRVVLLGAFVIRRQADRPCEIGIIARDVTERRRRERDRQVMELALARTQKLESLEVMAAGIAHDFNNLLTGVLGFSELALDQLPADAPARESIQDAMRGARDAADLARQMLAYAGKGRFTTEPIALSELVRQASRLLRVAVSKQCQIELDLLPDLPAIEGDATQLRQVVVNLVLNASEAIGEREGAIRITTRVRHCDREMLGRADIGSDLPPGPYVELCVSDDGCGIPEPVRGRMFDPFFSTHFVGRGLGLSVVSGIVRGHRAALHVESEPGKGSSFRIWLPISDRAPAIAEQPEPASTPLRRQGVALVVDDEEAVRRVATRMLEGMGLGVLVAEDAARAIALMRQNAERIVVALVDLTMPGLDGTAVVSALRRIRKNLPAIISSGYNARSVSLETAGVGPITFLAKPYRRSELEDAVRRVLEPDGAAENGS